MDYLGIDYLIVYAFLLITLLLGLWAGRGIKDIRDYALANKTYDTGVLTITFLATFLGGNNTIAVQTSILSYGLIGGIIVLSSAAMLVFAGIFIVPKMQHFKQSITLGDLMTDLYGLYGGLITGILGTVYTIGSVGAQLVVMGYMCEKLLGWPASWSIGIGGLILVSYSSFGGIKSVTTTDIFQFIILVIVIPLIANVAISEVGGIKVLLAQVPADKLTVYSHLQFPRYLTFFLIWWFLPAALSSPHIIQRILMTKHEHQARHMLFISAAFILVVRVLLLFTCLAVLILAPKIKTGPGGAFIYVIQQYFSPALKGLSIAGILAIIMSTVDSVLNAGGLLFTHNVLKSSFDKVGIAFDELKAVRYITFFMGCAGILASFSSLGEARRLVVVVSSVFAPVITLPLIAGILGLKSDTRAFLIAFALTIITFIFARLYLPLRISYLVFPITVAVNAITFLGLHILRYGGIVMVQRNQEGEEQYQHYPYTHETKQLVFALFICFNYMVPYFMYTRAAETTMFAIKFVGILLCVGLLLKPYWPASLKKYFDTYWHFCLLYCLPFTTTVLYLLNGGGLEWTINIALSIMLLLTLVDWRRFIIISLTGIGLGILYVMPASLSYENAHALAYAATFSTLIGLLFARRREKQVTQEHSKLKGQGEAHQASFLQAAAEKQATLKALQHTQVGELLTLAKELKELPLEGQVAEQMQALQMKLIPMAFQLQGLDTRSQDYLRLHIQKDYPIDELLVTVRDRLQKAGLQAPLQLIKKTQYSKITLDPEQMATLLIKSLTSLQALIGEEEPPILLSLEDTQLSYPLPDVEKGYIKYVPALRMALTVREALPPLAPSYQPDLASKSTTTETPQEVEQQANERIVKAHYGYAEVNEDTSVYVIPVDVREVRLRDMDKAYMEVDAVPQRANDHFLDKERGVDAQAQEATFLRDVAARSKADLGLVKIALELIKWYHGPTPRKSGEPFYLHPLAVAQIVLDYNTEEATIIGALLHDTVEDTPMQLAHVEELFGKETAAVVDLVTHLQSTTGSIYKVKMSATENLQMLERTGNKQGLYVKLADRMHNMRTIEGHKDIAKRQLIARETMDFFVPLAERLGLQEAAQEFRERCEAVLSQQA